MDVSSVWLPGNALDMFYTQLNGVWTCVFCVMTITVFGSVCPSVRVNAVFGSVYPGVTANTV